MNYEHIQNLANDLSNLRKDTLKVRIGNYKELKAINYLMLASGSVNLFSKGSVQCARKDKFFIQSP
jgi:hypothetical protein